jgi:hypothetical protein
VFAVFGPYLLVSSEEVLDVAGLMIYTDQTKEVGQQTRGLSPLERQAAMLWGAHHFNQRDDTFVSEITSMDYMDGCNIQLNYSFFDIGKTQVGAIQAYREATLLKHDHPAKVMNTDIWSSRTKTLSFLGKLDKIILTSGSATSDEVRSGVVSWSQRLFVLGFTCSSRRIALTCLD